MRTDRIRLTTVPLAAAIALLCLYHPFVERLSAASVTVRLYQVATSQDNTTLMAPATLSLRAVIVDPAVTVSRVEFYDGTKLLVTDTASPYTATVRLAAGQHKLAAAAVVAGGAVSRSANLSVIVQSALVHEDALTYQGAFRLPGPDWGPSTFAYGGAAIAFNPARQSLFLVGHPYMQQVAEVAVPEIRMAPSIDGLATAPFLQPLTDITEGRLADINPIDPNSKMIGGLLPYDGHLFFTGYSYYDGLGSQQGSHFIAGLDLAAPGDISGPFAIGPMAGYVSGYMGLVPQAWQAAMGGPVLNGQCCLNVISRTSFGPALFTIDPAKIGTPDMKATPLVYYPIDHPLGDWAGTNPYFNGSTQVTGVVFPENSNSVLFFGRHGLGPFCYGTGVECNDPADNNKGTHAYPYVPYVWAYDAAELAEVAQGRREPWDVRPYATWSLQSPYQAWTGPLAGAAYDAATGRIFLVQAMGDGVMPLVHVFTVARQAGSRTSTLAP